MDYQDYKNIGKVERTTKTKVGGEEFEYQMPIAEFYNDQKKEYRIFTRAKFAKVFHGVGREITEVLESDHEIGRMYRIMCSIGEDNMVIYSDHNKHMTVPCNRPLMLELIGGNARKAREFLQKLIEQKLIYELRIEKSERYFVSPIYTMTSWGISPFLYAMFREQLLPLIPEQAVKDLDTLVYYREHPEKLAEAMKEDKEKMEKEAGVEVEDMKDFIEKAIEEREEKAKEKAASAGAASGQMSMNQ